MNRAAPQNLAGRLLKIQIVTQRILYVAQQGRSDAPKRFGTPGLDNDEPEWRIL